MYHRIVNMFCFPWVIVACILCAGDVEGTLRAGVGRTELTPPIGTPSAGYANRQGQGMLGVHDPLRAISLVIDNGHKMIAFCSVDHLGFTYEMVQQVINQVQSQPGLENCDIFVGSSHTHSGGGAYFDMPLIGEMLAGKYDPKIKQFYIDATAEAIIKAYEGMRPAKIGVGYGIAEDISMYRSEWPCEVAPLKDVALIKVTNEDGSPFALLFNYPLHPTILEGSNRLFSADFVGFAREHIRSRIGNEVTAIYFNGAQGDIAPRTPPAGEDRYVSCEKVGNSLANTVKNIWDMTPVDDQIDLSVQKEVYAFVPQATPFGLKLPLESYQTEINLIMINKEHAFVTIPGELSSIYDKQFKEKGKALGIPKVSVLGLVNDAHGYIILPEAWAHRTSESRLSFGGEHYGTAVEALVYRLLEYADFLRMQRQVTAPSTTQ